MKTLLISAFSLLGVLGFSFQASEAQACQYRKAKHHSHWKHIHRHRPRQTVVYPAPRPFQTPVYFVAASAPTPQCYWSYGRKVCTW